MGSAAPNCCCLKYEHCCLPSSQCNRLGTLGRRWKGCGSAEYREGGARRAGGSGSDVSTSLPPKSLYLPATSWPVLWAAQSVVPGTRWIPGGYFIEEKIIIKNDKKLLLTRSPKMQRESKQLSPFCKRRKFERRIERLYKHWLLG